MSEQESKKVEQHDGWQAAREHTLTVSLEATPAERLEWLEEMIELAFSTGALPRKRE